MKRLVPNPPESDNRLKRDEGTGIGYHIVSVQLKDGRYFEQAVVSEGCIIQVRGNAGVGISGNIQIHPRRKKSRAATT
jgi:hypothetical protein